MVALECVLAAVRTPGCMSDPGQAFLIVKRFGTISVMAKEWGSVLYWPNFAVTLQATMEIAHGMLSTDMPNTSSKDRMVKHFTHLVIFQDFEGREIISAYLHADIISGQKRGVTHLRVLASYEDCLDVCFILNATFLIILHNKDRLSVIDQFMTEKERRRQRKESPFKNRREKNGGFKGSLTGLSIGAGVISTQKIWRSLQAFGDIAFAHSFTNIFIFKKQRGPSSPPP
ncbi:hypothetical protein EJB05_55300, partial [Eragrostis curvula]